MPRVSVLLPVRNAAPWLASSLSSLRRQTLRDLEVIAVDDGSTDGSGEILDRAAASDPRVRVFHTPARGLPAALNHALGQARAPYVARHDADDLSHRTRFALQLDTLRRQRGVTVVGSRIRLFPREQVGAGMRRWAAWHNALTSHETMAREILIDSTLVHGTAMMRRRAIERIGGWRDLPWAEDVDLWWRLLASGARFAKRREVLYGWRQHRGSATRLDPRYGRERLLDLKLHALEQGFVARGGRVDLVGVGESLTAWRRRLAGSHSVRAVAAGRPTSHLVGALHPPIVLVFGSAVARERWRVALANSGLVEMRSFIFVA